MVREDDVLRVDLGGEWEFRCLSEAVADEWRVWIPAKVPGTVHTDLMAAGLIPDPFVADNERHLDAVHQASWLYRRYFNWKRFLSGRTLLVCEGLDTVARVRLNGSLVAQTENQFLPYRLDVTDLLLEGTNCLEVELESPLASAAFRRERLGPLVPDRSDYDELRFYLRKAQYSFGWDWGPALPTCGIWRPIYLVHRNGPCLADAWVQTLAIQGDRVECEVEISAEEAEGCTAYLSLSREGEEVLAETVRLEGSSLRRRWFLRGVDLWWPNGHGGQSLYDFVVRLERNGITLDQLRRRVGFRTVELLTEDQQGPCFRFRVNGREIFVKGVNWIPADSFLPRVDARRYRALLELAAAAHVNMVRVWGGGVYEDDVFYDLCDELGLLVWQDFMFACGVYPETEDFLRLVEREAEANVRRLRRHPSLALWCGNNECEWIWRDRTGRPPEEMPGYRIFHELLPRVCACLDPTRPYWPTTPWGDPLDPNGEARGNRHQWQIWSGWRDYREVQKDQSLFVTEFGFQAPAHPATLNRVLPPESRHPQSRLLEFHNKQQEGPERLFRFLAAHFRVRTDYHEFVYLTQLNQGEALKQCIEHWRRRWPRTGGAVIWQLNDCWPVVSWSLIDSDVRPKAAYFYVRRAFAPVLLSAERCESGTRLWLCNDLLTPLEGTLSWEIRDFEGRVYAQGSSPVRLEGGTAVAVARIPVPDAWSAEAERTYLSARLIDSSGREVARAIQLFVEPKHANWLEPGLRVEKLEVNDSGGSLLISAKKLAKGVWLWLEDVEFEDNFFDLEPGEARLLRFWSLTGAAPDASQLRVMSVG
ncbi:MAG: glycoside hydrolase family 2 protein [candidate division KSB1 bacterium]|nr:glycoside hydrolase family 2 protein [candidate division KSB1 bacterium]